MRSLSASLLLLTIAFVMIAEVFIYVPSIANYRETYLRDKLVAAHLAALTLEATPNGMVDGVLEEELLATAGIISVALRRDDRHILVLGAGREGPVEVRYDMRDPDPWTLIVDAFKVMARPEPAVSLVRGVPPEARAEFLDVVMSEGPLRQAMFAYSARILGFSVVISLFTAGLVYLSLHLIFVRPMRRITESMAAFRAAPEDVSRHLGDTRRADEIGMAQRELHVMQEELRAALRQKNHLASLGSAVTKISHDLRNILATAQLVSDRLMGLRDPALKPLLPPLISSINRAISLAERTLKFGRADEPPPQLTRQPLAPIVADVRQAAGIDAAPEPVDGEGRRRIGFHAQINGGLEVEADAEQLHRALLNLVRNSMQAMGDEGGDLLVAAHTSADAVVIDVSDTGPGLVDRAVRHLFQPFASSTRPEGAGLGLNIAREIVQAHGGELSLNATGPGGTTFRIRLPRPVRQAASGARASLP